MTFVNPEHVGPKYQHIAKEARPHAPLEVPGARLKWYDIHQPGREVPPQIQQMARDHVRAEAQKSGLNGELGFVLLHRCGDQFYFLIVCTWRGNNELWSTVFYKENDAMPGFALFPRDEVHKPAYCVWELGPIVHERRSWISYLTSSRDERADRFRRQRILEAGDSERDRL